MADRLIVAVFDPSFALNREATKLVVFSDGAVEIHGATPKPIVVKRGRKRARGKR